MLSEIQFGSFNQRESVATAALPSEKVTRLSYSGQSALVYRIGSCVIRSLGNTAVMRGVKSVFFNFWTQHLIVQPIGELALEISTVLAVDRLGINFARQLPAGLCERINNFAIWNYQLRTTVVSLLGVNPASGFRDVTFTEQAFVAPVLEEVVSRLFIQEILLRRVPSMMLRQVAPSYGWLVESRPAKVARVVAAAALFALMHVGNSQNNEMPVMPQFITGLIAGIQVESSHNIITPSLHHMVHNGICWLGQRI